MLPRRLLLQLTSLVLLCAGGRAAEAPYFEDFNTFPPNGVPLNFVETNDADWSLTGSAYRGLIGLYSGEKRISSSINLSNVAGKNFTVTTKFSASMAGSGPTKIMDVSLGALGTDPNLNTGQVAILNYNLAGGYDRLGFLSLSGISAGVNYRSLPPTSGPYVLRLHGGYVEGKLFVKGTITRADGTRSVRAGPSVPSSGMNFGFLEHLFSGVDRSAQVDVAHDYFSVVFESERAKLARVSSYVNMRGAGQDPVLGFNIGGNAPRKIFLSAQGASSEHDLVLELYDRDGQLVMLNDNWADTQRQAIDYYGLVYQDHDAALIATLKPGQYTAIVHDRSATPSSGLLNIYDLESDIDAEVLGLTPSQRGVSAESQIRSPAGTPLRQSSVVNTSTRAYVGQGDDVRAFIEATGDNKVKVLLRALGPSLGAQGIPAPLADPILELYDSQGTLVRSNDNWRDSQEAEIAATSLAPPNDAEAAIVTDLLPTTYTAVVRGKNNTTGMAMVEVFHLEAEASAEISSRTTPKNGRKITGGLEDFQVRKSSR